MSEIVRKGDHVEIQCADEEGNVGGVLHHLDGTSEIVVAKKTGSSRGHPLEKCPGAGSAPIYHVGETRRGPARYSSREFCAGWEEYLKHQREKAN